MTQSLVLPETDLSIARCHSRSFFAMKLNTISASDKYFYYGPFQQYSCHNVVIALQRVAIPPPSILRSTIAQANSQCKGGILLNAYVVVLIRVAFFYSE